MTAEATVTTAPAAEAPGIYERFRGRMDLFITPAFFLLLAFSVGVVWIYVDFDQQTTSILEPSKLLRETGQHLTMTFWSTLIVVLIAIPLGILLTRPRYRKLSGPVLAVANAGQAVPAYGLLILFLAWLGPGLQTAVYALILYSILPILRNTMVGLEQVDQFVIEAGRGMGLSKRQTLTRIELPLAVPVILAGVRTALVINVGTAALAYLIGAGGLGVSIGAGLKLQRDTATFVAGALVAMLALVIDFTAASIERWLRPKGL
jgi:osmoprotectant transport system permease protein